MVEAEKLETGKETIQGSTPSSNIGQATAPSIDSGEWLLLFLAAGFVDFLFVLITIIGLVPLVGQVSYVIAAPILDFIATACFWLYLYQKGLNQYWGIAFGGGLANLLPFVNWIGWILSVVILYGLVEAQKAAFTGKAIQKIAKIATKTK